MKKNYKKYVSTMLLVWIGALLVFFLAYMIVLSPQSNTRKKQKAHFDEVLEQYNLVILASKPEHNASLLAEIAALEAQVKDYVVDFENSSNLTFDISQLANQLKILGISSKTKANQSVPNCKRICENQISVSFNGTFKQFLYLLNSLERHQPVVFVDRFSVTCADITGDNQVSMDLAVFVSSKTEVAQGKI